MVTTKACERAQHGVCGGEAAALVPIGSDGRHAFLAIVDCGCLCHAGSLTDEALERLLGDEWGQQ
jgi:hypothetical protein